MDPESKLFYRKLLDFGPGVGFREGQRKFEEEMRREEELRRNLNQDIAMNPEGQNFLKLFMQDRFA
tara:strand:- start:513 stop:710 length:198 start_codon:yes stop_codon:yes gene_type:complete